MAKWPNPRRKPTRERRDGVVLPERKRATHQREGISASPVDPIPEYQGGVLGIHHHSSVSGEVGGTTFRVPELVWTAFSLSTTAYEPPWKRRGGPLHLSEGMYRVVPKIGKFEAGAREDRTRHTSKQSDKLAFLNHLSSYRLPVGPGHKDIVSLPDTGKQSEIL